METKMVRGSQVECRWTAQDHLAQAGPHLETWVSWPGPEAGEPWYVTLARGMAEPAAAE